MKGSFKKHNMHSSKNAKTQQINRFLVIYHYRILKIKNRELQV